MFHGKHSRHSIHILRLDTSFLYLWKSIFLSRSGNPYPLGVQNSLVKKKPLSSPTLLSTLPSRPTNATLGLPTFAFWQILCPIYPHFRASATPRELSRDEALFQK